MKYSGLYFIPSNANTPDAAHTTVGVIVNSIETHFEHATRQSPWTLSHRLLRSVPNPPASNNAPNSSQAQPPAQQSLHHILHLSHLSTSRTYCFIHPFIPTANANVKQEPQSNAPTPQPPSSQPGAQRTDAGTIISIPSQFTDSHMSFLANQLQPLWVLRHMLHLNNGISYTTGQFTVHVGELKSPRSGASSASGATSPGVVVCITTTAGSSNPTDMDNELKDSGYASIDGSEDDENVTDLLGDAEQAIRGLWNVIKNGVDFGRAEVREIMMEKEGLLSSERAEKEATVRMWCDVLKLRV